MLVEPPADAIEAIQNGKEKSRDKIYTHCQLIGQLYHFILMKELFLKAKQQSRKTPNLSWKSPFGFVACNIL